MIAPEAVATVGALRPRAPASRRHHRRRRVPRRRRTPGLQRRAPSSPGHCPRNHRDARRCITCRCTRRTPLRPCPTVRSEAGEHSDAALARATAPRGLICFGSRRSRVNANSLSRCFLTGNDHAKTTAPCRLSLLRCGLRVLRPSATRGPKRLADCGAVNRSRASWHRTPRSRRQASCDASRRCSPNNRGSTTV